MNNVEIKIAINNYKNSKMESKEFRDLVNSIPVKDWLDYAFTDLGLKDDIYSYLIQFPKNLEMSKLKLWHFLVVPSSEIIEADILEVIELSKSVKVSPSQVYKLLIDSDSLIKLNNYKTLNLWDLSKLIETLNHFSDLWFVKSSINKLKAQKSKLDAEEAREIKRVGIDSYITNFLTSFEGKSENYIVNCLLNVFGFTKRSNVINKPKLLDKWIWLSTGNYLTHYISDISNYVMSSDRMSVTLNKEFEYTDFEFNSNMIGIGVNKIKNFYGHEVAKLLIKSGRLESNYKCSLDTLRSNIVGNKTPRKSYEKVSDYVGLGFVETHLRSVFTHEDYLPLKDWMDKYNIHPKLSDSGDDYNGIRLDECIFTELNKLLVKYDGTEFPEIRRELNPVPPEDLTFSRFDLSELKVLDFIESTQIINRLSELSEIDKSEVLMNQKILRIVGHLNITLSNLNKSKYSVSFNKVNWHGVVDLLTDSEFGIDVAKKVLSRMGELNKRHTKTLEGIEFTWDMYMYLRNSKLGI